MRTESEMLALILAFARQHDSIRAVVMNGSRVNPNVKKDPLQDYDVVYLVRDVTEFRRQESIPAHFGDPMIVQLPEDMADPPPQGGDRYVYLMQFKDGTRIDLAFNRVSEAAAIVADSLSVVLMDKDGLLGHVPPACESDYLTREPTPKAFADCCNEFWWLNPYVAKAIWRDQLPLAKYFMESLLRAQLTRMLCWGVVVSRGRSAALGKHGALLSRYMGEEEWALLKRTYAGADYEDMWASLTDAGRLFRSVATRVAEGLGYQYPARDDDLVSQFVQRIRRLPPGAREI